MARKIDKDLLTNHNLTQKEFQELARATKDVFYFSQFIKVIHPVLGKVPFNLYGFQVSTLIAFIQHKFNVVLKFRQAGVTELISLYCLWMAMYHPYKNIVIISIKDRVAKKVLRKIKFMYNNLPAHLKTPVINGRGNDIGCVTEDTILIGHNRDFQIGEITPKEKGVINVEHLGIKVLTHQGTFERVLKTVNKGVLKTFEIQNDRGKTIRCTGNHKLYTTQGWKFVSEILDNNLDVIFWDASYLDEVYTPVTIPPKETIILETRYKGYFVSNQGDVYTNNHLKRKAPNKLYKLAQRDQGHLRVKLKGERNGFESVHRLVWETFNGPIPEGYVIDHIDCNRHHNYETNLQCITKSENTKRAYSHNRILNSNNYRLSSISLKKLGKLKALSRKYGEGYGTGRRVANRLKLTTKEVSHYRRGAAGSHIYVSKLKLINITHETIVDMEVENNHSYITKSNYINHNTATEMEFPNGSIITSIPTTEDAGRSEAVSLLVIDEAAIVRWADRIWAASWPTLSTGGRAIVNSCVTGDTQIIGKYGNFRIDEICPKEFGVKDISHLGIQVLSHKGKWQRVLQGINKGELETWELRDRFGNKIKCTPDHKFLTPYGWKSAREVVANKLRIIIYNPGLEDLREPPLTIPPEIEELRLIPGFPKYQISNLGKVYMNKGGKWVEKKPQKSMTGYYRISLHHKGKRWKPHVHNLVIEAFMGEIPQGYLVDHINCIPTDNYSTNLQIITRKENAQRAQLYSRGLKLGCKIGKGFPNLQLIGLIRDRYRRYGKCYGSLDLIIKDCQDILGIKVSRAFVSRIVNKKRTQTVQISKLKVLRKYTDTIYDIQVEEDHSYITHSKFINHNTAYGVGNFFHKLYTNAVNGGNVFNPIRLHWQMHPERDDSWYKSQLDILGPRKTAQEIDGDFLTSGNTVFNLADIKAIEDDMDEYAPCRVEEGGLLKVYKNPVRDKKFFIGADIATGRSQDYTSFSVMDKDGEEYVSFKGRIPIDKAEALLAKYGKKYNQAVLAPESNDVGLGVATGLQTHGYPNLYYSRSMLRKRGKSKPEVQEIPGWYTTKKNRPIIIATLEEDIREENIIIKDQAFCDECPTFIYDSRNRPVALNKDKDASDDLFADENQYTDDAIFAKAITNYVRKQRFNTVTTTPR